jgi:hypothetical protein
MSPRATTYSSRSACALIAGATALCAGAALAEPPPFLPPSLQKIVEQARGEEIDESRDVGDVRQVAAGDLTLGEVIEQLGDEDLETREHATLTLANASMWDESVLAQACELPDICAETRERILSAMFQRFQNSERPAIGISMDRGDFGIKITGVQQQFPASRTLRANDVLLKIGDIDFRPDPGNTYKLQVTTASYDPGELVDMLVLRDDREMPLKVELGRFDDLNGQGGPRTESLMREAFELRMHRMGLNWPRSGAIAAPISRFDWERASRASRSNDRGGMMSGGEASLVPGRPSGGIAGSDSRIVRVERARNDFKQPINPDDAAVLAAIREKLQEVDREINSVRMQMNDPRLNEQERAQLRERMLELAKQRSALMIAAVDR